MQSEVRVARRSELDAIDLLMRYELTERATIAPGGVVLVAKAEGEVVGGATAGPLSYAQSAERHAAAARAGFTLPRVPGPVWALHQAAVVPWARGRGIGRRLVEGRVTIARAAGAGSVLVESWRAARDESFDLLLSCGFEHLGDIPERWREASRGGSEHGPRCRTCNGSCCCAAAVCLLTFSNSSSAVGAA